MSVIDLNQYRLELIQAEQEALDYPDYMCELKNIDQEILVIEEELSFYMESVTQLFRPTLRCINGGKSHRTE